MSKGVLIALISTADGIHQDIREIEQKSYEGIIEAVNRGTSDYLLYYANTYAYNCRLIKIELHFSTEQ